MTELVLGAADAIGTFIESWGFKSIHGRIWAVLAMRKGPMPQTEIAELLGVSRSLVSLAMPELVEYGLVRATEDRRNAPYEARLDVWPTITNVIRKREWMLIERARVALEAALDEVRYQEERGVQDLYDARRIRLLLSMAEFAQTFLKLVMGVRMPRSLDQFAAWLDRSRSVLDRMQRRFLSMF